MRFIFPSSLLAMQPRGKALHYICNKGVDMNTSPMPKYTKRVAGLACNVTKANPLTRNAVRTGTNAIRV